ncbi:hypothetical protein RUMHYD_03876 [Blautia hydrogenotrophica DSM 10507]|uniref:Uncharacterized protein n=1 Tax=Blautia hydrogenotrophica (strain DSM 10507 / JCM 14656 / S5a33) TaxID=476272 RepID=C0CSK8_BLAHS|nr:hypothetical protein RUMHYD_03876 [Blautia hydrogenotrophica DSM 10507]
MSQKRRGLNDVDVFMRLAMPHLLCRHVTGYSCKICQARPSFTKFRQWSANVLEPFWERFQRAYILSFLKYFFKIFHKKIKNIFKMVIIIVNIYHI